MTAWRLLDAPSSERRGWTASPGFLFRTGKANQGKGLDHALPQRNQRLPFGTRQAARGRARATQARRGGGGAASQAAARRRGARRLCEIGRASCRERV